jgi:hypothetical protein
MSIGAMACLLAGGMLAALFAGCGRKTGTTAYAGLFPGPGEVEHAEGAGEITEFRDEGLYDFLDGGAELYFDYDIVAAAAREYELQDGSGVEVSIYDMGKPSNAFGIYSIFRYAGADRADIGNEAVVTPATIDFWKGRYYCKLFAFGSSDETEATLAALAGSVADRITGAGSEPVLLCLLPADGRTVGSEKYFRGCLALNNIRYLAQENPLALGNETEGVAAEYEAGTTKYTGFIIRYPGPAAAGGAFRAYSDFLGEGAQAASRNGMELFILEDGTTTAIALKDDYVVGVWDCGAADCGFIESVLTTLAGGE